MKQIFTESLMKKRPVNQKGNALIVTLFLSIIFAGLGGYAYISSMTAARESTMREDYASAQATAEFAAELAIANLSDMDYLVDTDGERISVKQDWVSRNLFGTGARQNDQRRITGRLGNYEYNVRVRSARAAHSNGTMPATWLYTPEVYNFGIDKPDLFKDVYEITATARHVDATTNPRRAASAALKTVVNYEYRSPFSLANGLAVAHFDDPSGASATDMKISGEDHYSSKQVVVTTTTTSSSTTVSKPMRLSATDATFSNAEGGYWREGSLTLNYRVDNVQNPYIPRTRDFSASNANDRKMIVFDGKRNADIYFLGGKAWNGAGYTATLVPGYPAPESDTAIAGREDYQSIQETSTTKLSPGGKFDVAVGSYEELGRLYQNYSGVSYPGSGNASSSAIDTWRYAWRQNFVGQYSSTLQGQFLHHADVNIYNPKNADYQRIAFSRHYVKNKDGKILVREYPSSAFSYLSDYSGNRWYPPDKTKWTGYYVWTDRYRIINYGMYNPDNNRIVHARDFSWEELQGYELLKDIAGVPAKVLRDYNGNPVPWPSGISYIDARGNLGTKSGLDVRIITGPGDTLSNVRLPVNSVPVKLADGKEYLIGNLDFDRRVIMPGIPDFKSSDPADNGVIPPFIASNTIQEKQDILKTKGIQITGFDEGRQHNVMARASAPGINFLDGAIRVKEDDGTVNTYRSITDLEYEKNIGTADDPDNRRLLSLFLGLEDQPETNPPDFNYSDMVFTINVIPPVEKTDTTTTTTTKSTTNNNIHWWVPEEQESLTGKKSQYAISVNIPQEIRSIADPAVRLKRIYEMLGIYDPADPDKIFINIHTMTDKDGNLTTFSRAVLDTTNGHLLNKRPYPTTLYYANDDLHLIIYLNKTAYEGLTEAEQLPLALIEMQALNPDATFAYIDERFNGEEESSGLGPKSSATLTFPNKNLTGRQFTASAFGHQTLSVPSRYTKYDGVPMLNLEKYGVSAPNPDRLVPPVDIDVSFLPGEFRHEKGRTSLTLAHSPDYVPLDVTVSKLQPNGQPVAPRLIFKDGNGYRDEIWKTPSWLDIREVQRLFGVNDRRGGLGWHRAGIETTDPLLIDYYEYVILVDKSFNPYMTATAEGQEYLANVQKPVDRSGNELYQDIDGQYYYLDINGEKKISVPDDTMTASSKFSVKLRPSSEMPKFVIDGGPDGDAFDGAGLLVVNGNLEIQTTFAYHGTLVVLGDLIVTPTEYDAIQYGADGNPVDKDGNSLWKDLNGRYYYLKDGAPVYSEPLRNKEYKGTLIAQGKVLVGGKVEEVEVNGHKGMVDIRGSRDAVEDTLDLIKTGQERFVADRMMWNSDDSLYQEVGSNVLNLWRNVAP